MRNRPFKYFALLVILLSGSGCEKYVNYVNSPVFEQKLVITSFISPSDTVSQILVSSNQPLYSFSDKLEDCGDLTGTISDGINEVKLDTNSAGLYFTPNKMPVSPGKTYTLKVSGSKGLYAEAVTTVPQKREILINVDTVTREMNEYMQDKELVINIELTDYPGESNYYNVIGKFTGYQSKTNKGPNNGLFFPRYWFEYINDKKASPDNRISLDSWIIPSLVDFDSAFLNILLLNTDESFYLYHTSLYEYDHSDNPFSEARPVYSNIDGGLGIFTSYTIDSLKFRLK